MMSTGPSLTTEGIRISVKSIFLPEQTLASAGNFSFAYRIHILNESADTIQLLRRHWEIFDGQGRRRVVAGDGVVGQQPVLMPRQEHVYVSGSVFPTPVGKMEGFFTFRRVGGGPEFRVAIPAFLLISPFLQN